jgi:predicted nucleic acid-binding protein
MMRGAESARDDSLRPRFLRSHRFAPRRDDRIAGVRRILDAGGMLAGCAVTLAEVRAGMRPHEEDATLRLLESLRYLHLSPRGALLAGKWRADFRAQGVTLSIADCLVGATAVEHAATLVTDNVAHYPQPEVTRIAASDM